MRVLKITTIKGKIFLYPVPVLKENKYLIRCASVQQANDLIIEISKQTLSHPDMPNDDFKVVGIHTDQQTEILERS
jgi:hypothetical protein